jgi:hypothetical protein
MRLGLRIVESDCLSSRGLLKLILAQESITQAQVANHLTSLESMQSGRV